MEARGFGEVPGQGLGEHGNRAAHQHRGRSDQDRGQDDIHPEGDGPFGERQAVGDRPDQRKEIREEEGIQPDSALQCTVSAHDPARRVAGARAASQAPADAAEQRVADRQSAQEDRQHRHGGLGVGTQQGREILLPTDLVDQPREARHQGKEKSDRPHHESGGPAAIR